MAWTLPAAKKTKTKLGLVNGQLRPCPGTPNCVCSQSDVEDSLVPFMPYQGSREEALHQLLSLLAQDKRATVVTADEHYIHAEYRAFIFIDDVEFYLPNEESVVHVRSASRVGHSDLGANRRRVRAIAAAFSSRK